MAETTMFSLGITEILITVVVFVLAYIFMGYRKKKKNLPPGPIGLPIIGCFLHIRKDAHLKLQEMAEKYGDVFSIYLGNRLVLVLNGVDAVKEGLHKTEFLGRPSPSIFEFFDEQKSIISINGKAFHEQRKFMLHSMRDLGLGKTALEDLMKAEVEHFLKLLADTKGQPYVVSTALAPSVSNNITALVYGERYNYDDSRRILLDTLLRIIQGFIAQNAVHGFLPWLVKIPFVKHILGYHRAYIASKRSITFTRNRIDEHKKTLDPNHARDYVDKFLLEMQRAEEKKLKDTSFTENMLIGNAGTIFGAGSESVQTTLNWCFLLMATNQEVQKKVQEEISAVIGSERMPSYSDQRQMPYTQCVIMEVMRHKTAVALNILRCSLEDTTFRGYDIPKNTIVLANLWSVHYDKRYWKDPEKFLPERFLSDDRKSALKPEAYMPFSVGRRSCPGESMAVVEVFIYFTAILQRFDIRLPEGFTPDLEGQLKITYSPKQHHLCCISRSSE